MPVYMDLHKDVGAVTEEDLKAAHLRDLEVQEKHGVQYLTYWFNSPDGQVFCLVDAPSAEAAIACHKESHGLLPHKIIEVERPNLAQFMGNWEQNVPNEARLEGPGSDLDTGLRAVMFTDIEGSTAISVNKGDGEALEVIRTHDEAVRQALSETSGREVKHTGDGIMASFTYVSRAIDCALKIQSELAAELGSSKPVPVRVGLSAGEPVADSDDLFGATVNLAARICSHANSGEVLVSSAVKELSIGKPFNFFDRGVVSLKGFGDSVQLFQVAST